VGEPLPPFPFGIHPGLEAREPAPFIPVAFCTVDGTAVLKDYALVDTGAPQTLLPKDYLPAFGLTTDDCRRALRADRHGNLIQDEEGEPRYWIYPPGISVQVGPYRMGIEANFSECQSIHAGLGYDFLAYFLLTIDWLHERLTLTPYEPEQRYRVNMYGPAFFVREDQAAEGNGSGSGSVTD
jgi:hypothetical protein